MEGDWPHLDVLGRQPGSQQFGQATAPLYDALVIVGPDPKDPTKPTMLPYLATSWEQSPTQIVFKLRNDATCTDGTRVTPSLVKRTADIRFKGTAVTDAFGPGPYTTTADDAAGTFTVAFGTPFSEAIWGFLGYNGLQVVCPAALDNPDMLLDRAAGSGPYVIESSTRGEQLVLKRRDDWKWGPNGITAKDLPERVIFRVVTNETTAANLVLTGGLDVTKVGGLDVSRLLTESSLISTTATSFYNTDLIFSHKSSSPTADIKVREALVSAIDVNAWNQAANAGRGEVSPSFLMPKADCFDPTTAELRIKDPNPEKAKQTLLSAGWTVGPNGKLAKDGKPLSINLLSSNVIGLGSGGEYLASQWEKAGITVVSNILDFPTYVQRFRNSDYDAFTAVIGLDQGNPNRPIGQYTGKPPGNSSYAVYPQIESAIAAGAASVGVERCKQWSIVQKELLKNFVILPLSAPRVHWFSRGISIFAGATTSDVRWMRRAKR
jgi:peptide/nickel transport system substrate-binding protein